MSRPIRPRARPLAPTAAVAGALGLAVVLSACTPAVSLEPAADATDPGCAEIIVRLPTVLPRDADDQGLRETNAQATAAWGNPASILLRCGITPLGPTTLPCIDVNGIDWVEDDSNKPKYRYISYGRVPATEVIIDSSVVSGTSTLVDLGPAVSSITQTNRCVGAGDSLSIPTDAPDAPGAPAPSGTPAG